jgi:hypothetical protein
LYDAAAGTYFVAKFEDGKRPKTDLRQWYPDMQSQFWPVLFGIAPPGGNRAQAAVSGLNTTWNGVSRPNWSATPDQINGGWISADVAYGAFLAGERSRVDAYLKAVYQLKGIQPQEEKRFEWPFTAADAGWLLELAR